MIFCCGEALIDMIVAETAGGEAAFVPRSGGAVFNTAIALGRLGQETGFLSGLSSDLFGDQLRADLAASQVDFGLAVTSANPTTLAFVQLKDGQARYTFYDENTAGRSLQPDQLPVLPDAVGALFFGGISLISEPCAEFYTALALREAGRRLIAVDPNIRAGFITDEAGYRVRLDLLFRHADIVKVSDEDLDWIMPGPQDLADKAARLRAMGPLVVVLTRGSDGASGFGPSGRRVDVAARKATVVDTVGAGDTFNAGVLASLSERGLLNKQSLAAIEDTDLARALDFGARVAAITVSRSGANPPWADELTEPDDKT